VQFISYANKKQSIFIIDVSRIEVGFSQRVFLTLKNKPNQIFQVTEAAVRKAALNETFCEQESLFTHSEQITVFRSAIEVDHTGFIEQLILVDSNNQQVVLSRPIQEDSFVIPVQKKKQTSLHRLAGV
jgi:hypothetical protein